MRASTSDGAVEPHTALRQRVRDLCAEFPDSYWRDLDGRRAYPEEFVAALPGGADLE
jgi:hypothetical protein